MTNRRTKNKMTTYLTESTKTFESHSGHMDDGEQILTITLWADGERIRNFGGMIGADVTVLRAKAAEAANKWDGTTGEEVRRYDEFIREMDKKEWEV